MSRQLRVFDQAAEEIEKERNWYRERSISAEASFLRQLDQATASILESPARWPAYIDETRRYVFPTFPFSIVDFVEEDSVFIVALAHDSRRPGYWRTRLR